MSNKNYIKLAKKSAAKQISELKKINKVFNSSFVKAVETIYKCHGTVSYTHLTLPTKRIV